MLMFQYGFLTTFIPELLMVVGFALCIIPAAFRLNDYTNDDLVLDVVHVIQFEPQKHCSAYQVTIAEFQKIEVTVDKRQSFPPVVEKTLRIRSNFHFSTSEGLTFVDFSRPPPALLS